MKVAVATLNEKVQAEPLKSRLEESRIPAEISEESVMERLWFVGRPLACVKLKVRASDYQKALRVLHIWDAVEGVMRDAIRCPACGSSRIEYPQLTKKFLLPNLLGLLAAVGLLRKEFFCKDCQYTWPGKETKPPRRRRHMAPNYFIEGVAQPPPGNRHEAAKLSTAPFMPIWRRKLPWRAKRVCYASYKFNHFETYESNRPTRQNRNASGAQPA